MAIFDNTRNDCLVEPRRPEFHRGNIRALKDLCELESFADEDVVALLVLCGGIKPNIDELSTQTGVEDITRCLQTISEAEASPEGRALPRTASAYPLQIKRESATGIWRSSHAVKSFEEAVNLVVARKVDGAPPNHRLYYEPANGERFEVRTNPALGSTKRPARTPRVVPDDLLLPIPGVSDAEQEA